MTTSTSEAEFIENNASDDQPVERKMISKREVERLLRRSDRQTDRILEKANMTKIIFVREGRA